MHINKISLRKKIAVWAGASFILSIILPINMAAAENKPEKEYILIGRPNPSTGAIYEMGEVSPWVDKRVIDVVNAEGGIYIKEYGRKLPLKVKIVDTESDPNKAINVAAELILKDKIDLMVVMHTPDTVIPVSAVCEKSGIPCISTQCPVDPWLENGPYKWSYHAFWTLDSLSDIYLGMWDQSSVKTNRVVGFLFQDDPDGWAWAGVFKKKLPARGYRIVSYENFGHFASDFSPAINLFKNQNTDIVAGVMIGPDWATFCRQAQKMNFNPKIITIGKALIAPSSVNSFALESISPEGWTTEKWWGPSFPFRCSLDGHSSKDFCDEWTKATGKQPTMVLGFVHAGFEIAIDALKRAQTLDKEKLRQAIEDTDLDTIIGHIKFNKDHYCETPLVGAKWTRGKKWPWELEIIYNKEHPEILF